MYGTFHNWEIDWMAKIKVAFIKFGGMAIGGTEKVLQTIAAELPKDEFEVDYFYCDAAPYIGSDFKHIDTDPSRVEYVKEHGVNTVKFNVEFKDVTKSTHDWVNTDFWEHFDEYGVEYFKDLNVWHIPQLRDRLNVKN